MKKIFLITLSCMALQFAQAQQNFNPPKAVMIDTNASEDILPDLNTLTIGVTEEDKDYDDASEKLVKKIDLVKAALLRSGIEVSDIKVSNFNVRENYSYEKNKSKLKGYRASTNLFVEFPRDYKKVGNVFRELHQDDASISLQVGFKVSDALRKKTAVKLRKLAMTDAKATAIDLVSAVGEKIKGLNRVTYNVRYNNYQVEGPEIALEAVMRDDAPKANSFNIAPMEVTISESVSTEWLIE